MRTSSASSSSSARATDRRGRCLAYNRAMPRTHTPASRASSSARPHSADRPPAVGHRYARRLYAPRRPAWQTGQALGITKAIRIGDVGGLDPLILVKVPTPTPVR
ncbi:hypothetical protein GCM10027072_46610 [Streptomyces bullii]